MNITKGTIARTVVLIIALINQALTMTGYNPLPWSDEQLYDGVTVVLSVAASVWAWWKNNSFTKPALQADELMKQLKNS